MGRTVRYGKEGYEIHGMPEGTVLTVEFSVDGFELLALNGGPHFTPNPSISFMVNCTDKAEVDALWEKLSEGGKALMPLDSYPFSERYGWIEDKFGVSWQIIYTTTPPTQKIFPSLLFVGDVCGKAKEAMELYTSVFPNSRVGTIAPYPAGMEPDQEGTVMFGDFTLFGEAFAAMDSAREHAFAFSEGISLIVYVETQEELDTYWHALSAVPAAEQCGWLKDKFGVSWQVAPRILDDYIADPDPIKAGRVMQAMLQMKKLDIAALTAAYEG